MTPQIIIHTGQVIGRDHLLMGKNCQDALAIATDTNILVGVICDGCGEGGYSEVGARLGCQFIASQALLLLKKGISPFTLPQLLYWKTIAFLEQLLGCYTFNSIQDRANFTQNHFLFTVNGFLLTPEVLLFFSSGDGIRIVGEKLEVLDQNNQPLYIGYHLVDPTLLTPSLTPRPTSFDTTPVDPQCTDKFAIGSDAWVIEQALLTEVWSIRHPNGLQRFLNLKSRERHFTDDASLITVQRQSRRLPWTQLLTPKR